MGWCPLCPAKQPHLVGLHPRVRQYVGLQLVGPVELPRAAVDIERALVPLHRVVHQFVSFELVAAVEGGITDRAGERLLAGVDDQVYLEVVGRLEALLAVLAAVEDGAVCHHVPAEVPLAGEDLVALVAGKVMRTGRLVLP